MRASEAGMSLHAWTLLAQQLADAVSETANMHPANSGGSVDILDLAADGPTLAAGLSDGSVHVYSAAKQSLLYVSRAIAAGSPVTAVANGTQRNSFVAVAAYGVRAIRDGSVDYTTMCGSFAAACVLDAVGMQSINCMHSSACDGPGNVLQSTSDPTFCFTGTLTPRARTCTAQRSALTASYWQSAARAACCSLILQRSSLLPCLKIRTRKPSHRCAVDARIMNLLLSLFTV